jgi:tight adherence protein C
MVLAFIIGLVLTAVSGVLILRSFGFAYAKRARALEQISVYGFRAAEEAAGKGHDLRATFDELATATGERAIARFERLRANERTLRELLNSAGLYKSSVARFVGTRILAALTGASLLILLTVTGSLNSRLLFACVLMTVMGWYLPLVRVQRRARMRVELIDREVPELVDLLVTTVEAGVGFAAALQLASRSIVGPLGQELRLALREQSLGLTPEEALRNLSVRVDSPATRAFTQALVQGEALGVSIGTILRDLAIDMRKQRRQKAEERAQKTATKILFPLVGLMLPAMFIVALGPVALQIKDFFTS